MGHLGFDNYRGTYLSRSALRPYCSCSHIGDESQVTIEKSGDRRVYAK
jgi:hypothetical protein